MTFPPDSNASAPQPTPDCLPTRSEHAASRRGSAGEWRNVTHWLCTMCERSHHHLVVCVCVCGHDRRCVGWQAHSHEFVFVACTDGTIRALAGCPSHAVLIPPAPFVYPTQTPTMWFLPAPCAPLTLVTTRGQWPGALAPHVSHCHRPLGSRPLASHYQYCSLYQWHCMHCHTAERRLQHAGGVLEGLLYLVLRCHARHSAVVLRRGTVGHPAREPQPPRAGHACDVCEGGQDSLGVGLQHLG